MRLRTPFPLPPEAASLVGAIIEEKRLHSTKLEGRRPEEANIRAA